MRSVKVRVVVIVVAGDLVVIIADNTYCAPHRRHGIEDYYAQRWTTTRRALIHFKLSKL